MFRQSKPYPGRFEPSARRRGDERAESQHEGEPAPGGDCVSETQAADPGDGGDREEPAEVGEALELARVARDEVAERGRIEPDLREGALGGVAEGERPDEDARADCSTGRDRAEPRPAPGERVDEHERDRAEGEVDLAGKRDRRERGGREPRLPALDAVEREREQHRDRAEQVTRRLRDAVRRQRECETADERRAEPEAERAQPERGEPAGADVRQEHEEVPAGDRPEERLQRSVDNRERPPGEVHSGLDLRLEAVRIEPWLGSARELVPGKPEGVRRLQVVSGRNPSLVGRAVAEETVGLEDGGRGGEQPGAEVEGGG